MALLKKAILNLVGEKLLTEAAVAKVEAPNHSFRFIDLVAEAFSTADWNPGDKVQINVGNWDLRTYTPFSRDAESGLLRILAYLHGHGPGAEWAKTVSPGEKIRVLGPRRSLDFSNLADPVLFFGDETSFGVAHALRVHSLAAKIDTRFHFEVSNSNECEQILDMLGIRNGTKLYMKSNGADPYAHLQDVARHFLDPASQGSRILTGSAKSISYLRAAMKERQLQLSEVRSKPYWAQGKVGID